MSTKKTLTDSVFTVRFGGMEIPKKQRAYIKRWFSKEQKLKEGDVVKFEMPPFCSGDYLSEIFFDEKGNPYIDEINNFIDGCRSVTVIDKKEAQAIVARSILEGTKSMWFTNRGGTIGIVLVQDPITKKKFARIKSVDGHNESIDTQDIIDWGSKINLEQATKIYNFLSGK